MIVSFVEGRVRLRHSALTDADNLQALLDFLKSYPGILKAQPNARTGSLLIEYDPSLVTKEMLMSASEVLQEKFDAVNDTADGQPSGVSVHSNDGYPAQEKDAREEQVVRALEDAMAKFGALARSEAGMLFAGLVLSVATGFLGKRQWHTWIAGTFATMAMKHFMDRARR